MKVLIATDCSAEEEGGKDLRIWKNEEND